MNASVSEDEDFVVDLLMAEQAAKDEALLVATAPDYGQTADVPFKLRKQVIDELVQEKANLNTMSVKNGNTPLCQAVIREDVELIDYLINLGADLHTDASENSRHVAPLHLAAFSGRTHIMQHLLDKGAHLRHEDLTGATAFFYAAEGGACSAMKMLVEAGLSPSYRDRNGKSALCRIALDPDVDMETIDCLLSLLTDEGKVVPEILSAIKCMDDPDRNRKNRYVESVRYKTRLHLKDKLIGLGVPMD